MLALVVMLPSLPLGTHDLCIEANHKVATNGWKVVVGGLPKFGVLENVHFALVALRVKHDRNRQDNNLGDVGYCEDGWGSDDKNRVVGVIRRRYDVDIPELAQFTFDVAPNPLAKYGIVPRTDIHVHSGAVSRRGQGFNKCNNGERNG